MGLEKEVCLEFGVKLSNKEVGGKRSLRSLPPTKHTHTFVSAFHRIVTFLRLPFTRQVLVSHHKSNEEQLKCTTGTDPCKDHQQPSSAFASFRGECVGRGKEECYRVIVDKNESNSGKKKDFKSGFFFYACKAAAE